MMTVRFPPKIEEKLTHLEQETHRTKSYYIKRAVEEFLEGQENYLLAVASYEDYLKSGEKSVSLEELEQKLALHDNRH